MANFKNHLGLLVGMVLMPVLGWSQDMKSLANMSFEELINLKVKVEASSKKKESVQDAPSNITVITNKQIKEWGLRDIKDLLNRVAGFYVSFDRDEWVFGARGNISDNNQAYMILIDGHRMNSTDNFGPGMVIEIPNDLSNVKQVEIIRGPGSVVWGADAMAGVINIVTKTAADLGEMKHQLSYTSGVYDTQKVNFQFGHTGSDSDLIVSGSFARSNGRDIWADASTGFPLLDVNYGLTPSPRGRYTTVLDSIKPSYRIQAKGHTGDLTFNAYQLKVTTLGRQYEAPHIQGRENDQSKDQSFVEVGWEPKLDDKTELTAKVSGDSIEESYNPLVGTSTYILWKNKNGNASVDMTRTLGDRVNISLGTEYTYTVFGPNPRLNNLNVNTMTADSGVIVDKAKSENAFGGYFLLTLEPARKVKFVGGGRVDHLDHRGSVNNNFNPRLALIWEAKDNTVLKTLYNTGFMRPSNFQNTNNSNMAPMEIHQVDVIAMHQFGAKLFVTATGYWQEVKDFITIEDILTSKFNNSGRYQSRGAELEVTAEVPGGHNLWANAAYCDAEAGAFPDTLKPESQRVTPANQQLNYPPVTANLGGTAHLGKKVFVSPAARYLGKLDYRKTPAILVLSDATYGVIPAVVYLDANIGYEPNRSLGLYIFGNNLLNKRAPSAISIWNGTFEPYGLYVEGKVTYKF